MQAFSSVCSSFAMDNLQQRSKTNYTGQRPALQGWTWLKRLRTKFYSNLFHAVLGLNCGPAKC